MLWLVFASLIWAFSFGLIKTRLAGLPPDWVALVRMGFAFSTCFVLSFTQRNASTYLLPAVTRAAWKIRGHLVFVGIVQLGIMYNVYLRSFQFLAAYQVALFTAITPVWVWLIAQGYEYQDTKRWKISLKECAVALSAVVAATYVAWLQKSPASGYSSATQNGNIFFGMSGTLFGFILVQIANFCFSLGQIHYIWVIKHLNYLQSAPHRTHQHSKKITAVGTMNFVFLGAILWLSPALGLPSHVTNEQWLVLLYLGTVATGLGFYIWNQGAIQVGKLTLAVTNNLKTPLAVFISMIVFKEKTDVIGIISSLLLLGFAQWAAMRLDDVPKT